MNPLSLFQRAHRRLPLTPEERAILKFTYMTLATAGSTGLTAAAQYVGTSGHAVNWQIVFYVFLGSFSVSLYETARKWVSANGDGPLGAALQLVAEATKRTSIAKQVEQTLQGSQEPAQGGPNGGTSGVPVARDAGVR